MNLPDEHEKAVALNAAYMKAVPQVSVRYYYANTPFADPDFQQRYSNALRAAGLPE